MFLVPFIALSSSAIKKKKIKRNLPLPEPVNLVIGSSCPRKRIQTFATVFIAGPAHLHLALALLALYFSGNEPSSLQNAALPSPSRGRFLDTPHPGTRSAPSLSGKIRKKSGVVIRPSAIVDLDRVPGRYEYALVFGRHLAVGGAVLKTRPQWC